MSRRARSCAFQPYQCSRPSSSTGSSTADSRYNVLAAVAAAASAAPSQQLSSLAGHEQSGATPPAKSPSLSPRSVTPQQHAGYAPQSGSQRLAAQAAERLAALRTADALLIALQALPPAQTMQALATLGPVPASGWPHFSVALPAAKAAATERARCARWGGGAGRHCTGVM